MGLDLTTISVADLLRANNSRSEADAEVNSLYHVLEYCTLDAVSLVKVAKELQKALRVRREAKEIQAIAQQLAVDKFNPKFNVRESTYRLESEEALSKLKENWSKK